MNTQGPSTEALIIGGGVMGCAIARQLALEDISCLVLERSLPGAEASSNAAGMLAAQAEAEGPGPLLDLCLASRALWPDFAAALREESGVDIGYRRQGIVLPAFGSRADAELRRRQTWQVQAGLSAQIIDQNALRSLEPQLSHQALGALFLADEGQVSPPSLCRALHQAAAAAGARFQTGTYVRRVEGNSGDGCRVLLDNGEELRARWVVVAGGAWSSLLEGSGLPGRTVRPARGQILELDTTTCPISRPIFNTGVGYLVPRPDGRVLVGSTVEMVGFTKEVTVEGLHHLSGVALELVPALAQVSISRSWAALRPWSEDGLPILGPAPQPGVHLATGHFRNGLLLTPISASLVVDLMLDRPPTLDPKPYLVSRFAGEQAT